MAHYKSYECLNRQWQSCDKPPKMKCPDCGTTVYATDQNEPNPLKEQGEISGVKTAKSLIADSPLYRGDKITTDTFDNVENLMQEYATQVAEAVLKEAIRIQDNWRGDEHDESLEHINISDFIK